MKNNNRGVGRKKSAGRAKVGTEWKFVITILRRDTAKEAVVEAYSKFANRKGPEKVRIGAKTVIIKGVIKRSRVE